MLAMNCFFVQKFYHASLHSVIHGISDMGNRFMSCDASPLLFLSFFKDTHIKLQVKWGSNSLPNDLGQGLSLCQPQLFAKCLDW